MMRWILIGAAALLVTVAPACRRQQAQTGTTETTAAAGGTQGAAMSSDDKEFMTKAAQGSMLEVALGQEVAKRTTSPDVKAFANRMVADHGKAKDELKQLATKKGLALPTELKEDKREDIDEITKESGPKLDHKYVKEMVDDHEDDVEEFRDAAKEVKDPELRAWAARTLPILESHLAQAKELKAKLAPEK